MDAFVARQPIFNRNNKVVAYELLFRNGYENSYSNEDGDRATLKVITNTFNTIGINNVTAGKKAFINFTENLLKEGIATIVSPDILAVEILENVEPSEEIILQCKELKKLGYTIALDDFVFHEKYLELIKLGDIIKVDFRITKGQERKEVIKKVNSNSVKFLAEKVESIEEFNEAKAYGYSYFQGYYFSKPVIIKGKDIPSHEFVSLKILQQLNSKEINLDQLEKLILRDVSLSYKLLRFINSAAFGFRNGIKTIRQAITLIGEKEIVKWLYVVLIKELGKEKNDELINCSLIRAKFSENIALKMDMENSPFDAYIVGMLSVVDCMFNKPMEEIVEELFLSNEVSDALIGKNNYLNNILSLVKSYEKGGWDKAVSYSKELDIEENQMTEAYLNALSWATKV